MPQLLVQGVDAFQCNQVQGLDASPCPCECTPSILPLPMVADIEMRCVGVMYGGTLVGALVFRRLIDSPVISSYWVMTFAYAPNYQPITPLCMSYVVLSVCVCVLVHLNCLFQFVMHIYMYALSFIMHVLWFHPDVFDLPACSVHVLILSIQSNLFTKSLA